MKITNLEIYNFRGIRESSISFPVDSRIICLIGAGDSTKSTLLKAIEWVFFPTWNLIVSDSDFHNGDTASPIVIRGTFEGFPEELSAEDKFGLYLRKPGAKLAEGTDDEPNDKYPICLTIQLTIDISLEPKWEIVCNRHDPRIISHSDRRQLYVGAIGSNVSKDLAWGKNSVLQKHADSKGVLHEAYIAAIRDVAKNADLGALDNVSTTLLDIGKKYGVNFNTKINNRLLLQGNAFSSTVGLFDGDVPLNQSGTGSQRLLSMGLNIGAVPGEAVLLIDEIESGLEPYRLRNLINEFRSEHGAARQIIMTTHSPIVVAECTIEELMVVHSVEGITSALTLKSDVPEMNNIFQAEIRRNAEAFLSKRIIVCEGKTEIGFIRAIDDYISGTKKYRVAYRGVGIADGSGSSIFNCANILRNSGYDICIMMDSDKESEDAKKKKDMRTAGIPILDWDKPNAFEEQCFVELPMAAIQAGLEIAIDEKGASSIVAHLNENSIPFNENGRSITLPELSDNERKTLGKIAKDKGWYKRIDLGERFGRIVTDNIDNLCENSTIKKVLAELIKWVERDDKGRT